MHKICHTNFTNHNNCHSHSVCGIDFHFTFIHLLQDCAFCMRQFLKKAFTKQICPKHFANFGKWYSKLQLKQKWIAVTNFEKYPCYNKKFYCVKSFQAFSMTKFAFAKSGFQFQILQKYPCYHEKFCYAKSLYAFSNEQICFHKK